ncbi:hypothetical protein D3C81_1718520 [compost metagenome]
MLGNPEGLLDYPQQLPVDRAIRIGLVVSLIALANHGQHTGTLEPIQFAHDAAFANLGPPGDFVGVEALPRFAIQQAEHFLLGSGEQGVTQGDRLHGALKGPKKGMIGPNLGTIWLSPCLAKPAPCTTRA